MNEQSSSLVLNTMDIKIGETLRVVVDKSKRNQYEYMDWDESIIKVTKVLSWNQISVEVIGGKKKGTFTGNWTISQEWNFYKMNTDWDY